MAESRSRQFNVASSSAATLPRLRTFPRFPTYVFANFSQGLFAVYLINSFNQGTAWIIPVLLTFLQLKYQGNDRQTPFTTHSKTMNVAVCSSVVYYLAYLVQLRFSLHLRLAVFVNHCLECSSYASVASLASVLLPDSATPFLYGLFVMLPASELLHWFYNKYCRGRRIPRFLINLWRVPASSSGELTLTLSR
ncbi:UNVERIFIED_CONTAM: hypothetical protein Sradi_2682200 [Sesamum radiatum]|uniref:Very-long-chain (3R)-3-hydroxyacyl-CoA dehydratase n=1 Tax=Sesamum radiatum TaxID=300843 RepID=A0AAW2S6D0_SESRA